MTDILDTHEDAPEPRPLVIANTFGTEGEAQAVGAELNAAAERDVRYRAERYREKWAIARQVKRTYWGWHEYPDQVVLPKPPPAKNDVETVRQIVNLALGDGKEMIVLMTLLERGNKNGISKGLPDAGAARADRLQGAQRRALHGGAAEVERRQNSPQRLAHPAIG